MGSFFSSPEFKRGMILMWNGTIATIPGGWALCDGSNGTPDLRNRMIVCADADSGGAAKTTVTGSATQSGGSATKNLAHTHTGRTNSDDISASNYDGSSSPLSTPNHTHAFTTDSGGSATQDVMNPYYALALIMKL